MIYEYPLTVGLPHTNLTGLAEPQLMTWAGHFQWSSIAKAVGVPLSRLKTKEGEPIYATFFYIESELPENRPLNTFRLDENLLFINRLRHFKGMAINGEFLFDHEQSFSNELKESFHKDPYQYRGNQPFLRMCNVFISPHEGNEHLKISPPQDVSFDVLETLSPDEQAYGIVREAAKKGTFGMFEGWTSLDARPDAAFDYNISPERDTNGAGLVYFANYFWFLELAEHHALANNTTKKFTDQQINFRSLLRRKIGYYANVTVNDRIRIKTNLFTDGARIGSRSFITRCSDNTLIALAEGIKTIPK